MRSTPCLLAIWMKGGFCCASMSTPHLALRVGAAHRQGRQEFDARAWPQRQPDNRQSVRDHSGPHEGRGRRRFSAGGSCERWDRSLVYAGRVRSNFRCRTITPSQPPFPFSPAATSISPAAAVQKVPVATCRSRSVRSALGADQTPARQSG